MIYLTRLSLVSFSWFCWIQALSSATTSSVSSRIPLDLSYLFRTKPTLLGRAIKARLCDESTQDLPCVVDIDLTSSLIDKDIDSVIDALHILSSTREPSLKIRLTVRRNSWTASEATRLLQAMIAEPETIQSNKTDNKTETAEDVTITSNITTNKNETAAETKGSGAASTTFGGGGTETMEVPLDTEPHSVAVNENVSHDVDGEELEESEIVISKFVAVESLDLGWNNYSQEHQSKGYKKFLKALQGLLESPEKCPKVLSLDVCGLGPAACRAIGKGVIGRYSQAGKKRSEIAYSPVSLRLARNEAIGDPGIAAISAAIRTVTSKMNENDNGNSDSSKVLFRVLDLSDCGIGDTGAEALAIALEKNPACIQHLDLSNNEISDEGAATLGRALLAYHEENPGSTARIETLDLSYNQELGNTGAQVFAEVLSKGIVQNIILRSCQIYADGAVAFANALQTIRRHSTTFPGNEATSLSSFCVDLSGNPLGTLRKKSKSGGKLSATALKSKASATTAAYMNLIGKTVQRGLQDLGIADSSSTLESDDEEEKQMDGGDDDEENGDGQDPSRAKCGALAFASAFLDEADDNGNKNVGKGKGTQTDTVDGTENLSSSGTRTAKVRLQLRRCFFDTKAAEALAAVVQDARANEPKMDLSVDARMNNVLEDEMVAALRGDADYASNLQEMAGRHLDAMEVLRFTRERSREAARATSARMKAEQALEDAWGAPPPRGRDINGGDYDEDGDAILGTSYGKSEDRWDSDADYEEEEEYFSQ